MHLEIILLAALAASANSASVQKSYNTNKNDAEDVPIEVDLAINEEPVKEERFNQVRNLRRFENTRNEIKEIITTPAIKSTTIVLQQNPVVNKLLPTKENPQVLPSDYPIDSISSQTSYKTKAIVTLTNKNADDFSRSEEEKSSEYFPQKQLACGNLRNCQNQRKLRENDNTNMQYQLKPRLHTSASKQTVNNDDQNNTDNQNQQSSQQDEVSSDEYTEYKPTTILEQPKVPRRNFTLKYDQNNPESRNKSPQTNESLFINKLRESTYSKKSNIDANSTQNFDSQTDNQGQKLGSAVIQQSSASIEGTRPQGQGTRPYQGQDTRPSQGQDTRSNQGQDTRPNLNPRKDDMWVWGVEKTKPTQNKTDAVGVDDRAAFSGDKCATGMVRFAGKCVETD